ncbi:MAG: DUF892 family protein [Chloroflexota bacterium]
MPDDKNLNTVQQYVGDMVALESHIEEAIDRQVDDDQIKEHPQAAEAVRQFHSMVKGQREALKSHLQRIGGSEPGPLKSGIAGLFGMAAGAIDKVRAEKVSKALRDDFTAFNHAAMGYAMLHTTAHALGQQGTMDLADRHLRAYAKAVQQINQMIPDVVVWELRKDGHPVDEQAIEHCTNAINQAWRDTSPSHAGATSGMPGMSTRAA